MNYNYVNTMHYCDWLTDRLRSSGSISVLFMTRTNIKYVGQRLPWGGSVYTQGRGDGVQDRKYCLATDHQRQHLTSWCSGVAGMCFFPSYKSMLFNKQESINYVSPEEVYPAVEKQCPFSIPRISFRCKTL